MIGLDANVVVRALADDDPDQTASVRRMLGQGDETIRLDAVVLVETAWVMASRYGRGRRDIAGALRGWLAHPRVVAPVEAVTQALAAYEAGGPGLSDHLIGALNAAAGCRTTLTFDKRAARGPHFTLLD